MALFKSLGHFWPFIKGVGAFLSLSLKVSSPFFLFQFIVSLGKIHVCSPEIPRPKQRDRRSGDNVSWAVRTLAQALGVGVRRHDWRDASGQRRQRTRLGGRSEPRWFARAQPRRPFTRIPKPPRGRPFVNGYAARDGNWQRIPGRPDPLDWRDMVLPRRGRPVAVIEAPGCPGQKVLRERQPRGLIPRGTPRRGPERSAEEPWRNPRGGLCGGPARSVKEPQTPKKAAQPKASGKKGA